MDTRITARGERHGLLETVANSNKTNTYEKLPPTLSKEMKAKMKDDLEIIDVQYMNMEDQDNGKWEGWYSDHPVEPMRWFRFLHGESYKVPRGLVKKINAMGAPVRSGLMGTDGKPLNVDGKVKKTHQLIPVGTL